MERTKYMQKILNETYPDVAIEAIRNGFENAWERLIVKRLRNDYENGNSESEVIMESVGGLSTQNLIHAAKMITSSKIPEHVVN